MNEFGSTISRHSDSTSREVGMGYPVHTALGQICSQIHAHNALRDLLKIQKWVSTDGVKESVVQRIASRDYSGLWQFCSGKNQRKCWAGQWKEIWSKAGK